MAIDFQKIQESKNAAVRAGLWILSLLYGIGVRLRTYAYSAGILRSSSLSEPPLRSVKVICVGNIAAGGTGKTPTVEYIVRRLREAGKRVTIISRGYKRQGSDISVVSDGRDVKLSAEEAGDEPYLLAQKLRDIPVVVGADRYKAGVFAVENFSPDFIVLDDGFQHLSLKRDVNIAVVDSLYPLSKDHLLPRGTLREPLSALNRADVVFLTHTDYADDKEKIKREIMSINPAIPAVETIHRPICLRSLADNSKIGIDQLKERKVLALSGIGNPKSFQMTLEGLGARLTGFLNYPDHHYYTERDLEEVSLKASELDSEFVITTRKDAVKFAPQWTLHEFRSKIPIYALEIEIQITKGADKLDSLLKI